MKKMERHTFWESHIDGWQHSGISRARYCKQHHLLPSSFSCWFKRLRLNTGLKSGQVHFAKASLPSHPLFGGVLTLHGNGWRLDIPMDAAVDWVSDLLRTLGP